MLPFSTKVFGFASYRKAKPVNERRCRGRVRYLRCFDYGSLAQGSQDLPECAAIRDNVIQRGDQSAVMTPLSPCSCSIPPSHAPKDDQGCPPSRTRPPESFEMLAGKFARTARGGAAHRHHDHTASCRQRNHIGRRTSVSPPCRLFVDRSRLSNYAGRSDRPSVHNHIWRACRTDRDHAHLQRHPLDEVDLRHVRACDFVRDHERRLPVKGSSRTLVASGRCR